MKISKNISNKNKNIACVTSRVTSSADRRIASECPDGTAQFSIVAPKGIDYVPQMNDNSVVISSENERLCIGVRRDENLYEIKTGELALYSQGGAYILLKNDGTVIINGQTFSAEE